jgi:hypothetical protein
MVFAETRRRNAVVTENIIAAAWVTDQAPS